MKKILLSLITLAAVSTYAVPSQIVLKKVDAVQLSADGAKLTITYTLPCSSDDAAEPVYMSDDTGDMTIGVGVAYSMQNRNCRPTGQSSQFVRVVEKPYFPEALDYSVLDVAE